MAKDETEAPQLSPISGEFFSPAREAEFQADRLQETLRQLRILLAFSIVLNSLFLISDWRFQGTPHFYLAIPARVIVVAISSVCLGMMHWARSFTFAQRVMLVWEGFCSSAIAVLVSSHSDIALFVVLLLPMIYYLVVPTAFRWTIVSGAGCSALMLGGYLWPGPLPATTLGLLLALAIFNCALALVVSRSNRLQRLEWMATQAERQARRELERGREDIEKMFMAVPVPLGVTTRDGRLIKRNLAAAEFFGWDEAVPEAGFIRNVYMDKDRRKKFLKILDSKGAVDSFEARLRVANGQTRDVLLSARPLVIDGEEAMIVSNVDISERKEMERNLEQLATTDPLTGLPNRTQFLATAERTLRNAQETGLQMAMLMVDVDDFKRINDTQGHDAGDALLCAVAERLRQPLRHGDHVARLGGDEFAIILADLESEADVTSALDRLQTSLREPFVHGGRILDCGASIGVSFFPSDADNIEDLMKNADIALYTAKASGKGDMRRFESGMRAHIQLQSSMISLAREALLAGQFVPFYQPKMELASGQIIGFEALLRWRHPIRGILPPAVIRAAFDHHELADAISDRMLDRIIADILRWQDQGVPFGHVALNASPAEFRHDDFAERVLEKLERAAIPTRFLELEVTETVFLGKGAEYVGRALRLLSEAGVRISLDDFGTGYASLSHLKQFPVDIIKIDRSFVSDIMEDSHSTAIVKAVLSLSQDLGLQTVAEGIETVGQAAYLLAAGCDLGQGYLFSKPVPGDYVATLLASSPAGLDRAFSPVLPQAVGG